MKKSVLIGIIVAAVVLVAVVLGVALGTPNNNDGSTTTTPTTTTTTTTTTSGNGGSQGGDPDPDPDHTHTEVVDPAVEATCTKTGLTAGKHCSECGETLVAQQEVPMVAHIYDDDYDKKCNVCDFERIVACKHDDPTKIILVEAVAATCQETGLTEGMKCTLCGTMVVPQMVLNTIECIESDWIVDKKPTNTEDGKRHTECTMCKNIFNEETLISGNKKMEYVLVGETYQVKGIGNCTDTDIVIPSTYNGLPVTSIGEDAFTGRSSLTSVTIPDSVTIIGH
jgi:hypothetical protein